MNLSIPWLLERQEKLIRIYRKGGKDKEKVMPIIVRLSEEIAIIRSGGKCEYPPCSEKKYLQHHHLVTRDAKYYMPMNDYIPLRYSGRHVVILCYDHHQRTHHFKNNKKPEDMKKAFISPERIAKVLGKSIRREQKQKKDLDIFLVEHIDEGRAKLYALKRDGR